MGFIIRAACPREEPPRARDAPAALAEQRLHGRHHPHPSGNAPQGMPALPTRDAPGEGLLWTASQLLLAFLLCKLRSNLYSPLKKVFFLPSRGKKSHFQGSSWGWDSSWHALAGCNLLTNTACGDAALLASAGYIPPPSLPCV